MTPSGLRTRIALYTIAAYQAIALTTVQFIVPVYVSDLSDAPSRFLMNVVIFSIPFSAGFFLAHLVGAAIDVTGRVKPFMLLALAAHLAGLALLVLFTKPWAILAAAALAASFTGTLNTTLKTYVTRLSEEAKGTALSRLTMAAQIGWLIGGGLTLTLTDLSPADTRVVLLADVVLTLFVLALVAWLLPRLAVLAGPIGVASESVVKAKHTAWSFLGGIREDLAAVYAEPALVRGCVAAIFLVGGNWIFVSTFSIYVHQHLGAPPSWIGLLNIAGALIALTLLPVVGWICDKHGAAAAVRVGALAYVGCYVILTIYPSVFAAGVVFSIPAYASLLIGLTSAASDIGGVKRRGGGIGVVDGLWAMAIAAGSAVGGLLADVDLALIPPIALGVTGVGLLLAWSAASKISARLSTVAASRR